MRAMEDTINVLHIDDEPIFLQVTKQYLNALAGNELKIYSLSNPLEVFKELKEKDIDVIVIDYKMPEMNGLELLEELRNTKENVPVIIFTGQGREEVAITALNLGADYYIEKGGDPKSQYSELAHIIWSGITRK